MQSETTGSSRSVRSRCCQRSRRRHRAIIDPPLSFAVSFVGSGDALVSGRRRSSVFRRVSRVRRQ
jgi:hypothetical protein